MKFSIFLLTFFGFNLFCFNASAQCVNIVLADSSFEEGTLAPDGSFEKGEWYPDDGCGISGAVAYEGDSSACSNGGGAYQLISVDSNTTYYLSCYVLNGYLDPMISFNVNWIHYPITVSSNSWEFASQSFNSGSDTAIFVGFYSGGACFDLFRLTCNELVNVDNAAQIIAPYKISSTLSSNYFGLKINRPCYIEVIDLNGRIHEQIKVPDGSLNLGQDLPPAIYILKISSGGQLWTEKIMKF